MSDWSFNHAALDRLVDRSAGPLLQKAAERIRDRARANARLIGGPSSRRTGAIQHEMGIDASGVYADIGYAKHHPGFVLWWHEVGTVQHPATPHLRPAVRAGRV